MTKSQTILTSVFILLVLLAFPLIFKISDNFCGVGLVSAQDTPCLAQAGTIDALEAQIVHLVGTNIALANTAQQSSRVELVTVMVFITTTPNLLATEITPSAASVEAIPTVTSAPTAEESLLEIVDVVDAGDITAEGVRIRNSASNGTVIVTGWTLQDTDGNVYEFRNQQRIFSNSEVTVYTRAGQDTPIALFWGLDEAVWQENDVVTLRDADGNVQAVFRVPADIDL